MKSIVEYILETNYAETEKIFTDKIKEEALKNPKKRFKNGPGAISGLTLAVWETYGDKLEKDYKVYKKNQHFNDSETPYSRAVYMLYGQYIDEYGKTVHRCASPCLDEFGTQEIDGRERLTYSRKGTVTSYWDSERYCWMKI